MKKAPSVVTLNQAARRLGLVVQVEDVGIIKLCIRGETFGCLMTLFYGEPREFTYAEARRFLGAALKAL